MKFMKQMFTDMEPCGAVIPERRKTNKVIPGSTFWTGAHDVVTSSTQQSV